MRSHGPLALDAERRSQPDLARSSLRSSGVRFAESILRAMDVAPAVVPNNVPVMDMTSLGAAMEELAAGADRTTAVTAGVCHVAARAHHGDHRRGPARTSWCRPTGW